MSEVYTAVFTSRYAFAPVAVCFGPEQARHHNGSADVAAEGKRDEQQRDLIAVSDRRERILADKLARDKAVRDIINLLKDHAAE